MADRLQGALTGVPGLDDILCGGLAAGRVFLLEGSPGTGKTTTALQFLLTGAEAGERGLYITLSETEEELRASAASHGREIGDRFEVFELLPPESLLDSEQQQSLLYSSDLELGETTRGIFDAFERVRPSRVVIDSLSEIRLLAQSSLRYRRQILALKHYFAKAGATVLMLDDLTTESLDKTVHSVAHGVIRLEEAAPSYGAERRRLRVIKFRGRRFRGGYHDFIIEHGGVRAFPRLISAEHRTAFPRETLKSESPGLDALLGGGIERGSSTLILGPAGTGKSLLVLTFIAAAARRGEKSALFIFDEERGLLFQRAHGLGLDLQAMVDRGELFVEQVDAAELSPGQFTHMVRDVVERNSVRTVVVDSLNGYQAAMPEEQALILHMHELLQYLNRRGAATYLTVAQHGLVGDMKSPVDVTYLADTVILLRYFEAFGRVLRAISVIKKRTGSHENTIREYRIGRDGVTLGEPLQDFQGVLRGVPTYAQAPAPPCWTLELPGSSSEEILILAPHGRDGPVAARMLTEAGLVSRICPDLPALAGALRAGAGMAVVTEEALATADLREVSAWLEAQPEWSDFPFVLLTHRGGGLERNPRAARFLRLLGNVTFVERPFHPTTLVSLTEGALRGRRRQYDARGRLEELRRLAGDLEERVEQRTREREEAQDALRQAQKMEAIGQLTGGVAHDFNNLLTVIRGSVDMLRRDSPTDDKRQLYVEAIGSTAERATKLTGQLLAFARRQALTPELFDAGQSLRDVAGIVRALIGSRVELVLRVPEEPVHTLADRGQFDTALVNMAVNARDAMDGRDVLTIELGPAPAIPAAPRQDAVSGKFVAVTVRDTGTGIAPELAERIFEPFFTTKGVGAGTGLGLSQVIGFAKQSGGDIRVASTLGEGAAFTLYLPRAFPSDELRAPQDVHAPATDGLGTCVLLVEDNEQVGRFATQALRELGYDSVLASDAVQALDALEREPDRFQIVFSDVMMPGMSGIELGNEIRRHRADMAIVLTSGYSDVLAQGGAHGFELLHKPYSIEQLSRILLKAGGRRSSPEGSSLAGPAALSPG